MGIVQCVQARRSGRENHDDDAEEELITQLNLVSFMAKIDTIPYVNIVLFLKLFFA